MAKEPILTIEQLRQLLDYDPEAGKFTWRHRGPEWFKDGYRTAEGQANNWNSRYAGTQAGSKAPNGYVYFSLPGGCKLLAHRVAFALSHGEWPEVCDHINGEPSDNRICNLRGVSQQENMRNARKWGHNTSGQTGVSWDNRRSVWMAYIKINGAMVPLGTSKDFQEAVRLRKEAEIRFGFTTRHGR